MNREDLIKKLELARVGNGTQTYNDVVVTLTKEETLELLKYIEKLEKENQELIVNKNVAQNIAKKQKVEIDKLEKAIKILKQYVAISTRRNEVNGNYDISCIYSFGSYKDITEGQSDLLYEVFESVGEK